MSDGSDTDKGTGTPREPDEAALAAMSNQELLTLGGKIDGVETVFKEPRWPVEGTQAEKRAERGVALWLLLGGGFGLALLLVFLFWPWEYKSNESRGQLRVLADHPAVRPDLRAVHLVDRLSARSSTRKSLSRKRSRSRTATTAHPVTSTARRSWPT